MSDSLALKEPPRRVLLVKPSAIGDVVHALPVLSLMRRAWPEAHIAWLIAPACSGLVEGHPMVSETITFDRRGLSGWYRSPAAAGRLGGLLRRLREGRFDLVLDLQGLLRSGLLSYATGAPIRVGLASAREGARSFYTHRVPDVGTSRHGAGTPRHAVDRYLDAAEFLGLGRHPVEFVFHVTQADEAAADAYLGPLQGRPFAVLVPGANWPTKRWPAQHFAALARLLREHLGLAVVVVGSAGDAELSREVGPDVSLCGRTTLGELTAVLSRATVVVANDTGPMHIAAALGRPLVTLFGPTDPRRTGPYRRAASVLQVDVPCVPCLSRGCCHRTCLRELRPQWVLEAAQRAVRASFERPSDQQP